MLKTLIIGFLLAVITATTSASSWSDPEIRGWVEELESPDLLEDRQAAIFRDLENALSDKLIEERTAEAVFALARFLPESSTFGGKQENSILNRMITLYPDDPRLTQVLRRLAMNQIAADQPFPAHFTLTRLFGLPHGEPQPELNIRAAANSIIVGDMHSAMDWTESLEDWKVDSDLEHRGWRVRLAAAQSLGRHTEAIAALNRLEEDGGDHLTSDAVAMLAAARIEVAAGRLESAEARYRDFVNVHTRSPQRASAMLEHANLLQKLQRTTAARRVLQWLIETHDGTAEADMARVFDVEWQPDVPAAQRATAYREVAMKARAEPAAVAACDKLVELLIAEGLPLEAVSTLAWMTKNTRGFPAIAARRGLIHGAEAAIRLLVAREDWVGVAAAAVALRTAGLPLPANQEEAITFARRTLGMSVDDPRLERAEALAAEARWADVNRMLAHVDREQLDDTAHTDSTALAAEALWRLGQQDAAYATIERTLETHELDPTLQRKLVVLRGDIDFARGNRSKACSDYRVAAEHRESPYVAHQLTICESNAGDATTVAP